MLRVARFGKQFGCGHTPKFLQGAGPAKMLVGELPKPAVLRDKLDLLTKWFSKKTVLKKVQEKAVSAIKSTKTGQENQSLFSK